MQKTSGVQTVILGLGLLVCIHAVCAETTRNTPQWEAEIAAYEAMDRTNPPPKGAVLFVGSSTIRLWKTLAEDFPQHRVVNRGFGGSRIADATRYAERIIFPYEPAVMFFRSGGNDLWGGKSVDEVFSDYKEFVAKVRTRLPETKIVFISWAPTPARWKQADHERELNARIQQYSREQPRLGYVETFDMVLDSNGRPRADLFLEDRLHFNAEGYRVLAERVRPFMPELPK
jgi:lysophospholipase L1-like esterase